MRDRFSGTVSTAAKLAGKSLVVLVLDDLSGIPLPGEVIVLSGHPRKIVDVRHETQACLTAEVLTGDGRASVILSGGRDLRRQILENKGQRIFGGPA